MTVVPDDYDVATSIHPQTSPAAVGMPQDDPTPGQVGSGGVVRGNLGTRKQPSRPGRGNGHPQTPITFDLPPSRLPNHVLVAEAGNGTTVLHRPTVTANKDSGRDYPNAAKL